MHKFDFKDQTAVITGGAQGFGLDIAKRFLDSGCKVYIWDIDEKLLKIVADKINNPNLKYIWLEESFVYDGPLRERLEGIKNYEFNSNDF